MEIIFHAHHAVISDHMRQRAERAVRRIAGRLARPVSAVVRFEEDGRRERRVEIVLHVAPQRRMVAEGRARFFGVALAAAAERLAAQSSYVQHGRKRLVREGRATSRRRAALA